MNLLVSNQLKSAVLLNECCYLLFGNRIWRWQIFDLTRMRKIHQKCSVMIWQFHQSEPKTVNRPNPSRTEPDRLENEPIVQCVDWMRFHKKMWIPNGADIWIDAIAITIIIRCTCVGVHRANWSVKWTHHHNNHLILKEVHSLFTQYHR